MKRDAQFIVVAGIDDSEMAEPVMDHALDMVNRHETASLHVLAVVPVRRGLLNRGDTLEQRLDEAHARVNALVREKLEDFEQGSSAGSLAVRVHVRDGIPAEEIVSIAADTEADLIVIGRHGSNRRHRFLVGSVPERVLKTASCSVVVVQPRDYGEHEAMIDEPCEACATTRRESAGERWFCDEHTEGRTFRTNSVITAAPGGGRLT